MAGGNNLVDERRPVVGPLLLQNGNEDQVELVQKGAFGAQLLFRVGVFDDEIDDEIADPFLTRSAFQHVQPSPGVSYRYLGIDHGAGPSIGS